MTGGLNWWIDLQCYPACFLFYAYGLAVLKAGHYDLLFRWLAQAVASGQQKRRPAIVKFGIWQNDTHERWKMLTGLERHRTPLSDHFHQITVAWTRDYTLSDEDHTTLFETFELLAALAFLTFEAETEQDFPKGPDDFVWSPIGRAGWDLATRNRLLLDLEQPERRAVLRKAGFSSGREKHYDLALLSMRKLVARLGRG
jgi:hypothetical protein